jgi:hypothetical protein
MAWRELVDLGSTLASKARRVGVATDLERVVRTRASETLLRIALGAPSGGFSPRNLVDRCFGDLDPLGVVDPRVPIARGLVYAGLSHDGDSVSFEPVLAQFPDPMDVPQPWRHAVRTLKRYKTMRTRADRVAISESALVPPVAHPFAQSPPSTSERVYHYLWRSRVAAVAVERFLEILGRGTIDRNAYELAVSHTRSALSFSRTGNSDDQRNFQLVGLGELHLCAGRYALAESTLADVTALKDRDIGLRDLVLAECALEQGDLDAAGRLLDTVSLQTLEGDVVSLRARLEFASGRVERADELVSRLGAMNGTFAPWRSVQNTIRILAGDDPRAPLRVR